MHVRYYYLLGNQGCTDLSKFVKALTFSFYQSGVLKDSWRVQTYNSVQLTSKKNWRVLNSQWSAHLATLLTWWDSYSLSYADQAKFSEAFTFQFNPTDVLKDLQRVWIHNYPHTPCDLSGLHRLSCVRLTERVWTHNANMANHRTLGLSGR